MKWIDRLFRRRKLEAQIDSELRFHIEQKTADLVAKGVDPDEARRRAMAKLGGIEAIKQEYRESRPTYFLESILQDIRYALRTLRKSPAFTAVAVLTLALGIGANATLFSLVDNLLLRSLPVHDPDQLVQVVQVTAMGKPREFYSKPEFDYIRAHNRVFSEMVGFNRLDEPTVSIDGHAEPIVEVERVSYNFFGGLGVAPIKGRPPQASDGPVAIISYRYWRYQFGASPAVLARSITINSQVYTIIGVAPPRFQGVSIDNPADIWISSPTPTDLEIIARLNRGVTARQAQAAMQVTFDQMDKQQFEEQLAGWPPMQAELLAAGKGLSLLRAEYARPLLALSVLVALVLLGTCTNVGSLLMVRNTARIHEFKVRATLGARRSRLIVQCLVESALLAALGGGLGLVFARWCVSILLSMLPQAQAAEPQLLAFQVDARVLIFTAAVSLTSALLFGLASAWHATRVDLPVALKSREGSTVPRSGRQTSRLLVAGQVCLSVVLVIGAGLFVRTLRNLEQVDVGFRPQHLLQFWLDTRGSGYRPGQIGPLCRLLLERVSSIPGVASVTVDRNRVMTQDGTMMPASIPGRIFAPEDTWDLNMVGPLFFETMGIPLIHGRTFDAADFAQQRRVALISEAFAKQYFPNDDPIGKRIGSSGGFEIIGVVGNAKLSTVRRKIAPMVYRMLPSRTNRIGALEVRAAGDPEAVARAVGQAIRRVNPHLLIRVRTMRQQIDDSIATERMIAATSSFFNLLGLLLASIGLFGMASYTVAQRTRELGIRIALGASRWSVLRESLRETMLVFSAGLAAGTVVAFAAARLTASFLAGLLFGLTATDAANIAGAVLLMIVVALLACYIPARRAMKVDPMVALRYE